MMMTAVKTPVHCEDGGVPSSKTASMTNVDEDYIVGKTYKCCKDGGHEFVILFESPLNIPVFWECPDHETIAFES